MVKERETRVQINFNLSNRVTYSLITTFILIIVSVFVYASYRNPTTGVGHDGNEIEGFDNLIPTGTIFIFSGKTIPNGWLLCDGSAISRTDYTELFSVINLTYGYGDGFTTFNIPDLRGRFPLGKDDMSGIPANRVTSVNARIIGNSSGSESMSYGGFTLSGPTSGSPHFSRDGSENMGSAAGSTHTHIVSGGGTSNIMNPYITLNYIIKYN